MFAVRDSRDLTSSNGEHVLITPRNAAGRTVLLLRTSAGQSAATTSVAIAYRRGTTEQRLAESVLAFQPAATVLRSRLRTVKPCASVPTTGRPNGLSRKTLIGTLRPQLREISGRLGLRHTARVLLAAQLHTR